MAMDSCPARVRARQISIREGPNMSGTMHGKVALVTGGSSGIGLATARRFAAEGARVLITGRRPEELDGAARSIGGDVIAARGDVSKLADLDRLYDVIRDRAG